MNSETFVIICGILATNFTGIVKGDWTSDRVVNESFREINEVPICESYFADPETNSYAPEEYEIFPQCQATVFPEDRKLVCENSKGLTGIPLLLQNSSQNVVEM